MEQQQQQPQPQQPEQPPDPPAEPLADNSPIPLSSFPPLPPPPELLYRTETEAVQAIKSFAQDNHYAVITKRTNKGREGKVEAIYMTCDQGQIYRSTAKERQRTPSRRNGCPFNLRISYHKVDNLWHVKVRESAHNHGPSPTPADHPSIRREEINQKTQYIKALLDINMPPSQILKQLRHVDSTTVIQVRDIYNLRHRLYQGKMPVPVVTIAEFKQVAAKKRRRTDGSDNQSSEEASISGAVEASEPVVAQNPATPVVAAAASSQHNHMHNAHDFLFTSTMF